MYVFHAPGLHLPDDDALHFQVDHTGVVVFDQSDAELHRWMWSMISQITHTRSTDAEEMDMLVFSVRDADTLFEFESEDTDGCARVVKVAAAFSVVTTPENFKVCV